MTTTSKVHRQALRERERWRAELARGEREQRAAAPKRPCREPGFAEQIRGLEFSGARTRHWGK